MSSAAKKKVLILGGTGFIGRNFVEFFAGRPGFEVTATHFRREPFATAGVRWLRADLRNAADCEHVLEGQELVIQAAATTSGSKDIVNSPHLHVTDNAVMSSLLFRAAHELGVKHLIFPSCTVMYPSSHEPQAESAFDADSIHPRYFGVAWTKVYLEKMCEFYAGLGRVKFTAIRHSNIYGPHDKFDLEKSHVFGASVAKVMTATGGKVTVWGTGREKRDLLHVHDLLGFVELALERQKEPFLLVNLGAGEGISVGDLVARIIAASGRDLKIELDPSKPSIDFNLTLDCSRARAMGWKARVGLDEGIRSTLRWYEENHG